jgi:hypothetical protein
MTTDFPATEEIANLSDTALVQEFVDLTDERGASCGAFVHEAKRTRHRQLWREILRRMQEGGSPTVSISSRTDIKTRKN